MKCPRCHGTGQIKLVTRYRVEYAEKEQSGAKWYTMWFPAASPWPHGSTTKYHEALAFYENLVPEPTRVSWSIKRLLSVSPKGRRKVLKQGQIIHADR